MPLLCPATVVAVLGVVLLVSGLVGADTDGRHRAVPLADACWMLRLLARTRVSVALSAVPLAYFIGTGAGRAALDLVLPACLALGWCFALKAILLRPRPGGFVPRYGRHDSAFPSAHTAGTAAVALSLAGQLPLVVVGSAGLWAVAVAVSRLLLRRHFLSDIGGGLLLAAASMPVANYLLDTLA